MSKEEKKTCNCTEECTCGCQDGKECICNDNCKCDEHKDKKKNHKEEKIKELEEKIKELEEKALRDKAEMINYRKRKDDEVSRMLKYKDEDQLLKWMIIT